jgi:(p)ppGpp synthase/HD superfamily hydrolase
MNLERAIEIAVAAHKGAVDKGGQPYILHPLAVMMGLRTDEEKIVGVLHDVVEDTNWNFEALREEGFSEEIIEALQSVTKSDSDSSYLDFIERAKANAIGRKVKIADLKHNMDITRIPSISNLDLERLERYRKSLEILEAS